MRATPGFIASGISKQNSDNIIGYALKMDTPNFNVNLSNILDMPNISTKISIVCWIKYLNRGVFQYLISKTNNEYNGYHLYIDSANKVGLYIGNSFPGFNTKSSPSITDDQWTFVGGTYNGVNSGGLNLYINGIKTDKSIVGSGSGSPSNTRLLAIGSEHASTESTNNFTGLMSQIGIYFDKELSESEMAQLYSGGTFSDWTGVGMPSGLSAYYPITFSDNYLSISDHSGNGYNGTPMFMDSSNFVPVYESDF